MPEGQVELAEPPVLGEPAGADFGSVMMYLPMGLGTGAMVMMFSVGNAGPSTYLMSGMMGIAMVGMTFTQVGRQGSDRRRRMRAERRDYLRYLGQKRKQARQEAERQRAALMWDNPAPGDLWAFARGPRLWERRPGHEDFARVRIGLGTRRAALEFVPPQTRPVEDLEPLCAISLRRFTKAHQTVPLLPVPVSLQRFTSVEFTGETDGALALARAMLGQLAVLHSPDELRIAVLGDAGAHREWDWLKWLPHNAHPHEEDGAGPVRLAAGDHDSLLGLLGPDVRDRPDHDPESSPSVAEPLTVVVAQGVQIPAASRLLGAGIRGVVLLDLTGAVPGGPKVLRLAVHGDRVDFPVDTEIASGLADRLGSTEAETLGRVLAPMRTSGGVDLVDRPLESDFDLTTMLNIRDVRRFDVHSTWRPRLAQHARLKVPIGVTEDGEVVELDLKESAQGGMGPHGLLIGATGSGKSELLRTLVMGLAATHSSEILNLVLVDFKGGATFLHLDRLPHTSAVITNLADELPLVDRMRDSINGEMIRRQELLREAGFASLYEYEKARGAGATLAPLPSLLIIVDEFSELLAGKPEFVELFVSIGRLGRSLGVHLLLASQRLDESRIHRVEGHLSYRIALRTFSSMESRSVIGASSAYELPSAPGNGYLKVDTTNLVRFKAAYVSGAAPAPPGPEEAVRREGAVLEVTAFGLEQQGRLASARAEEEQAALLLLAEGARRDQGTEAGTAADGGDSRDDSLLDILVGRLEESGPPARQVWLSPLSESPALDQLLPGIVPDPERGMGAADPRVQGALRVPLGLVDRPFEQLRELLVADLSGADGHIGLVGAPQTGKSTLLRTLILSLALTHTPAEVQFYCLDFGGGGLVSTAGLPHVGSVATRLERDRVLRTVEELSQLVEQREQLFTSRGLESMAAFRALCADGVVEDPYGDVFLVVDGWATLRQDFEDLEQRVMELAARGLSFGLHIVVSAVRWSEVRPRVRDLLGTKLELRLGDAMESEVGTRAAAGVPHQPGRGLTEAGHHFLSALPRLDSSSGTDDLTAATKAAVAEIGTFWNGGNAPGVRLLPTALDARRLPAPADTRDLKFCLGWDEQRLAPLWHDFGATPHLLVYGDGETGKTNALRLAIRAVTSRYGPEEARILLADPGRGLLKEVPESYRVGYVVDSDGLGRLSESAAASVDGRLPGADVTPEQLDKRDWWAGPQLFVLVDDYDLLVGAPGSPSPMSPLVPLLAQGLHIGLHLIVARSTSGAMRSVMDPLIRRMWELGNPALLFSYPKEEGKFIGEARPRTLPPGRAQLVTRRTVRLVQTGLVPAGPVPTGAR
ncbi:type VII secretion protein EccCa [Streptomyces cocklensis]|uniref:ESX secretion system protein EccC n=2 Tax=Actinacidiphila cocklensis TaxID=887465 RepID=A0A9W4DSP1_9ACTN|nr:type VII secretion protein EccCa [Actinacidiphila cocklensis]MDD1063467.1 type VII secretion protein EccCa [Actinacidiphila cocklensis]CAG6395299.1 ESX secretion system protein EccC [Actinacidiphila cocklensis]